MKKAKEEKFLQQNDTSTVQNIPNNQQKVSFLKNDLNYHSDSYNSHFRSFEYTIPRGSKWGERYALLRKIERMIYSRYDYALNASYPASLSALCKTTSLRYLCVVSRGCEQPITFPKSISVLQNLEMFITRNEFAWGCTIPLDIWKLQRLRHIIVARVCYLPFPVAGERGYPIMESLQTLIGVTNFNFSMDVIERIPNVKKMKLNYEKTENRQHELFSLSNLQHLHQLEELSIVCIWVPSASASTYYHLSDLAFPSSLRKLSLYNTNPRLSENFMSIGSLPNLHVLKLDRCSILGHIWEPVEGEFLQLKHLEMVSLYIEEWRAESFHFPSLRKLVINHCWSLEEVPECIGEIDTLEELVLNNSPKAKESVQKILENQQAFGNDSLKITIN